MATATARLAATNCTTDTLAARHDTVAMWSILRT